ncbi:hypothetical protein R5R35_000912 [Gryllus longicercus]|uniref:Uncharacterized protein n=1 Tax=Gryllus longicercus TaxID=2509291 RepID=A0AAN9V8W9_9ORTH
MHRPPSPATQPRRSSGTASVSPARALPTCPQRPGRSRSLDILVDSTANEPNDKARDEQQLVSECEQYLSAQELTAKPTEQKTDGLQEEEKFNALQTSHPDLDYESRSIGDCSDVKQGSQLSLPLSNTGDNRRKKNFMDRCVNKVRSFIKK